jgi:hypothetical protein
VWKPRTLDDPCMRVETSRDRPERNVDRSDACLMKDYRCIRRARQRERQRNSRNGLIAPFLLVGILIVASDRKIMREQPGSLPARLAVGVAAVAMFGAAIEMFVF